MELEQSIGYLLNTSARLIKRRLDLFLKRFGITTTQWAVLKYLSAKNNISQAEIASALQIDRATCGSVIEKLVEKALLEKALFEEDHRSYRVHILQKGMQLVSQATPYAEMTNSTVTEGISDVNKGILIQCLHTIIANLGGETYAMDP